MKNVLFVIIGICLVGCVGNQPKTYINKVKIYKAENQKVLYAKVKEKPVAEEYYKTNFKDTLIAENRLKSRMIERLNKHEKAFVPEVYKELEKNERFIEALKVKIAKEKATEQELKSIREGIKQIDQRILKRRIVAPLKNIKKRGKNEYSRD